MVKKQKEQHARLLEMHHATEVHDKKLSALQQQLTDLTRRVAARNRATPPAPPPGVAPDTQESAVVAEV